jgi:hypothetical protein
MPTCWPHLTRPSLAAFPCSVTVGVLVYHYAVQKEFTLPSMNKLFFIGLLNFIFYFNFPTSSQVWIMVSSFRYSLPAFIPLILGVFLLAAKYKKEELIGYVVLANMINVLTMAYYPKLVLIYLPLSLLIFYVLNRNDKEAIKLKRKDLEKGN